MIPIVFALVPTIVGAAMLIGLNNSGNKGALLFGELNALLLEDFAERDSKRRTSLERSVALYPRCMHTTLATRVVIPRR